ncbi:MAG: tRNA pseudouridine(38-40) synthase TruA [Panacagrimonas sp.]
MSRWAACVEYQGGAYSGWQSQHHAPSVQAAVEAALSRVADHAVEVVAAGRTDAGVHGYGQIIHFDSGSRRTPYAWLLGTNTALPDDVALRWVQPVADSFHARFSARSRSYRYVIHNARWRSALLLGRAAWITWQLDAEAMNHAAQALLGEQDFSAFRDSECQSRTPMREVQAISVRRERDLVLLDIRANAFLHHMVRNIAGSLIEVGSGKQPQAWIAEVLASRQRTRAGMNAPACGLYFVHAEYPAEFALPASTPFWLP